MEGRLDILTVTEQNRTYTIKMDALAAVPLAAAWSLLTDYPNLGKLNDSIKKGELLVRRSDTQHLVRVDAEACVLFYCKQLLMVQNVYLQPQSQLVASIVPEQSSFSFGEADLQLRAEGGNTRMRFHARVIPKFWVPPYIGTWLLEWKLRSEARDTIENMEQLARSLPLSAGR
jgi:hypothetical protein